MTARRKPHCHGWLFYVTQKEWCQGQCTHDDENCFILKYLYKGGQHGYHNIGILAYICLYTKIG